PWGTNVPVPIAEGGGPGDRQADRDHAIAPMADMTGELVDECVDVRRMLAVEAPDPPERGDRLDLGDLRKIEQRWLARLAHGPDPSAARFEVVTLEDGAAVENEVRHPHHSPRSSSRASRVV